MLKKLLKRFLPHPHVIRHHRHLKIFGERIHHSDYWEFSAHSLSKGLGVGVFACWLPMPFQSIVAAALALLIRGNIFIAVAAVFISNPITMSPMLYLAFKVGQKVLGYPTESFHWHHTFHENIAYIQQFAWPIITGTVICGIFFGFLSYFLLRCIWTIIEKRRTTPLQKTLSHLFHHDHSTMEE